MWTKDYQSTCATIFINSNFLLCFHFIRCGRRSITFVLSNLYKTIEWIIDIDFCSSSFAVKLISFPFRSTIHYVNTGDSDSCCIFMLTFWNGRHFQTFLNALNNKYAGGLYISKWIKNHELLISCNKIGGGGEDCNERRKRRRQSWNGNQLSGDCRCHRHCRLSQYIFLASLILLRLLFLVRFLLYVDEKLSNTLNTSDEWNEFR